MRVLQSTSTTDVYAHTVYIYIYVRIVRVDRPVEEKMKNSNPGVIEKYLLFEMDTPSRYRLEIF